MKVLWLHEGIESSFCVAPFFLVFGVPGIIADILVPCCSRTQSVCRSCDWLCSVSVIAGLQSSALYK